MDGCKYKICSTCNHLKEITFYLYKGYGSSFKNCDLCRKKQAITSKKYYLKKRDDDMFFDQPLSDKLMIQAEIILSK
jgi:hypothetical protein